MAPWIVSHIPTHRVYVEPFGGSAAVLLAKSTSPVEVYNDIDSGLINFFRVLRDPETGAKLRALCRETPYAREEWYACRDIWAGESDPLRRAWAWYVVAAMSFSGSFGTSWSAGTSLSRQGMAQAVSSWRGKVAGLEAVAERLLRVQVDHRDWRDVLTAYDGPETVFYLDPPYALSTRRTDAGYRHNLADADHRDLVAALLTLRGQAVLSGYDHPDYAPLVEVGWTRYEREQPSLAVAKTRATGRGEGALSSQRRTEVLWCSPGRTTEPAAMRFTEDALLTEVST